MKLYTFLPFFFGFCAAVAIKRQSACTSPAVRKEWRSLTDSEKSNYLEAVQCLQTTESPLNSSMSFYDAFVAVHRSLDTQIHLVASFLPWHRYFVQVYENTLRDECGYNGHAVYWDWTLDIGNFFPTEIFNAELGFGGNGDASTNCVVDGPFANLTVLIPNSHCLQRNFSSETFESIVTTAAVNDTMNINGYSLFRAGLESGLHRSAHGGIAGDMINNYSPNDPLFFLHHGNIDRLWWKWQRADNATRLTDYGGNRYQNDAATEATLNDTVPMEGLADDAVISDLMWVEDGLFCYTYEN